MSLLREWATDEIKHNKIPAEKKQVNDIYFTVK
jgi:hypothetical protein